MAALMGNPVNLCKKWYPDTNPELAGFWKGKVDEQLGVLDQSSHTSLGILVYIGDAFGDQGSA